MDKFVKEYLYGRLYNDEDCKFSHLTNPTITDFENIMYEVENVHMLSIMNSLFFLKELVYHTIYDKELREKSRLILK